MAAYNAFIYRMLKIPLSNGARNKERKIIYQIANENGYTQKTIDKLEIRIKQNIQNKDEATPTDKTTQRWTAFTYVGHQTKKLTNIFKPLNINITYKPNTKITQKINNYEKEEDKDLNGVYSIQCSDCNKFYIGQTKKKLIQRYNEHKKAYINPTVYKSNLATHAIQNKHNFPPPENIKLIKQINKGNRMDIWENLNIHKFNSHKSLIEKQVQIKTQQDLTFNILNKTIHIPREDLTRRRVPDAEQQIQANLPKTVVDIVCARFKWSSFRLEF
ncbi:uncharacterized protein [Leptinotarsa decemlineata]|uniref:uncharacterized protein n=1 Tax=Leptinotarsa decemlineata TaxID=7539 RepID=UPI003D30727C